MEAWDLKKCAEKGKDAIPCVAIENCDHLGASKGEFFWAAPVSKNRGGTTVVPRVPGTPKSLSERQKALGKSRNRLLLVWVQEDIERIISGELQPVERYDLQVMLAVIGVLALCYSLAKRVPAGIGRDVLWIVALAQLGLIALPILVGVVQLMVAVVVAIALIVLFVAVAIRFRK